jgi:hypothetical protein
MEFAKNRLFATFLAGALVASAVTTAPAIPGPTAVAVPATGGSARQPILDAVEAMPAMLPQAYPLR